MKAKIILPIIFIMTILVVGCNKTSRKDLEGRWLSYEVVYDDITLPCGVGSIPYMGFVFHDKTIITTIKDNPHMGTYKIKGNKLIASLYNEENVFKIQMLDNDRFELTFLDDGDEMIMRFKRIE